MSDYKNIEKHLKDLPVHKAPEDAWLSIGERLGTNPVYNKLPEHTADASIWNTIEEKIQGKKTRKLWPYWAAAASVAFILVLTNVLNSGDEANITVAEEIIPNEISNENTFNLKGEITIYCDQFPKVCSTDKFTQLKNQLDELKAQKKKLSTLKAYDSDPEIDVYIKHINMELATIERKLIAMF